jgi:FAD/FMN-containing dehydrogenase
MPTKGEIVADVTMLNKVIDIDAKEERVVVQSGITWEKLERQLNEKGLSIRTLPSSASSSTVGGWLAQSGGNLKLINS